MRYTVWRYQHSGFGHGWSSEQADTIPEGAVSVASFTAAAADWNRVYVVDNAPEPEAAPAAEGS